MPSPATDNKTSQPLLKLTRQTLDGLSGNITNAGSTTLNAERTIVEIRQPYAYDTNEVSDRYAVECKDESRTVQDEAEDADINVLVKRFGLLGAIKPLDRIPINEDFEGVFNYQDALDKLRAADDQFMTLPAEVRRRFDHDPGEFIEFCSNPANLPELEKMGLTKPKEAPIEPLLVRMQPEPPPDPQSGGEKTS